MIDWRQVGRAVYRVRQHYRYTYSGPVWDLRQRLLMIPRERHRDQTLLASALDVRGTEGDHRVAWERDEFGNQVARVSANRVPQAIDFEATFRVERRRGGGEREPAPWRNGGIARYLEPTALTAPDDRIEAAARRIADETRDKALRGQLAFEWATRAIRYEYGVTGYTTPAAMALHLGRGVCQDYAHIMLAACRLLGVACRYVSGHLLGEGAPHAWVEVLLPDPAGPDTVEVIAYDPTHGRRTRLDYLTVAVGRDFSDVSPTSGVYSGGAAGKLSATKKAEVVEREPAEQPA